MKLKALGYAPSEGPEDIDRQRRVWEAKPQVRSFYEVQVFPRIDRELRSEGPIVEIGSGAGTYRGWNPSVIATDIVMTDDLEVRCSALDLPFASGRIGSLVAINVLHHLPAIGPFLDEAIRVLEPGGRCIFVEPWITPASRVFYRWFHQEDNEPVEDPLFGQNTADDRPMHGNTYLPFQALSDRAALADRFPDLVRTRVELFSGLGWCLSMGFRDGALLPDRLLRPLLHLEDRTGPIWSKLGGLNALIVLERGPSVSSR